MKITFITSFIEEIACGTYSSKSNNLNNHILISKQAKITCKPILSLHSLTSGKSTNAFSVAMHHNKSGIMDAVPCLYIVLCQF